MLASQTYFANGTEFDATGIEAELRYAGSAGDVFVNLAQLNGGEGDATGTGASRIYNFRWAPDYTVTAGAAKRWGAWGASAMVDYTPKVDGPLSSVESWTNVSCQLSYEHHTKNLTWRHALQGRNLLGSEIAFPEFVRRRLNEIPAGRLPEVHYTVELRF